MCDEDDRQRKVEEQKGTDSCSTRKLDNRPTIFNNLDSSSASSPPSGNQSLLINALIDVVGGSVTALLTDLFVSGTGGPNLRSAMAHGRWDDSIQQELLRSSKVTEASNAINPKTTIHDSSLDVVDVLLVSMEQIAMAVCSNTQICRKSEGSTLPRVASQNFAYRPVFSFTSSTLDNLRDSFHIINQLYSIMLNSPPSDNSILTNAPESVKRRILSVLSIPEVKNRADSLIQTLSCKTASEKMVDFDWTTQNVLVEHETNKLLEPLGATRTLLKDILSATTSFLDEFQPAQDHINLLSTRQPAKVQNEDQMLQQPGELRSRQRNRMKRIVASSTFIVDVYSFAYLVAVLSLEHAYQTNFKGAAGAAETSSEQSKSDSSISSKEWLKVVERTRMVVSTVDSFIITNIDRSFKATDQYSKGAIVKKLISSFQAHP